MFSATVSFLLCLSYCSSAPYEGNYVTKQATPSNAHFQIKVDRNSLELTRISSDNYYQGRMLDGTKIEAVFLSDLSSPDLQPYNDNSSTNKKEETDSSFDSWSIVWYIASFGGLIAFFLIVSCSEWCCRRHSRNQQTQEAAISPGSRPNTPTCEVPPPAYELFAPPSYDTCFIGKDGEKREYDVYVVPVHAIRPIAEDDSERRESPPAYAAINVRTIAAQTQNTPT